VITPYEELCERLDDPHRADDLTRADVELLLAAVRDSDTPHIDQVYWTHSDDNRTWGIYGGDGDGVAVVTGSLFNGEAEPVARRFAASSEIARLYLEATSDE
jgi:hypothetical protein